MFDNDLKGQEKLLHQLVERAAQVRRAAISDRERIRAEYPETSHEGSVKSFIFMILEVDGDHIFEIAREIATGDLSDLKLDRVLKRFTTNRWFERPHVTEWYFQDNGYEKLKAYIDLLNYIRLVCLEYVTSYLKNQ